MNVLKMTKITAAERILIIRSNRPQISKNERLIGEMTQSAVTKAKRILKSRFEPSLIDLVALLA